MHRMWKGIAAVAFLATTASTTQAQGLGFGLHAGLALPMGDLGDIAGMGFQVGGELGFNPAALPVGIRIDVDFTRFGLDVEGLDIDGSIRSISGAANAILKIPSTSISPYVVGGVGMFNSKVSIDDSQFDGDDSSTDFGVQVGGGLGFNLAGFETAVEVKFVNIFGEDDPETGEGGSVRFVPITLRFMFGGAGDTGAGTGMRRK
jgi:opacity protein-like surface antigen